MAKRKILVADDEPDIVTLLVSILKSENYDVIEASDGEEALMVIKMSRPDAIILDIMMPKLDGMQVLRKVREDPEISSIPVIMLTAKASNEDILSGYKYGANYYIPKPFEISDILEGVRMVLIPLKEKRFKIS